MVSTRGLRVGACAVAVLVAVGAAGAASAAHGDWPEWRLVDSGTSALEMPGTQPTTITKHFAAESAYPRPQLQQVAFDGTGLPDHVRIRPVGGSCSADGAKFTCRADGRVPDLEVLAEPGVKAGAQARVKVEASAGNRTVTSFVDVSVGGLVLEPAKPVTGATPGGTVDAPLAVYSQGVEPARFSVTLSAHFEGIGHTEEYSNCMYERTPGFGTMQCLVEQPLERGVVYVPSSPVGLVVPADAATTQVTAKVGLDGQQWFDDLKQNTALHRGTGAKRLEFVERSAPSGATADTSTVMPVRTTLTADYTVVDGAVENRAYEYDGKAFLDIRFDYANVGRGTFYGEHFSARLDLPPGVTFLRDGVNWTACAPSDPAVDYAGLGKGDGTWYFCALSGPEAGGRAALDTWLVADPGVEGGTATLTFSAAPFDADPGNNVATLVLTPATGGRTADSGGGSGAVPLLLGSLALVGAGGTSLGVVGHRRRRLVARAGDGA
ncbi:hypothetical protein [Yinghuangia seranimata]|uniref:hypothetical protein n=1 Tax=Yinghuangia seranimata TaxID=408067 RepID=UPI00248CAB01|nr:hypothetical protein [Yinghuangia seranimata]MDI2128021.1 hypothetical protein [Yinghuangia seranimata]